MFSSRKYASQQRKSYIGELCSANLVVPDQMPTLKSVMYSVSSYFVQGGDPGVLGEAYQYTLYWFVPVLVPMEKKIWDMMDALENLIWNIPSQCQKKRLMRFEILRLAFNTII